MELLEGFNIRQEIGSYSDVKDLSQHTNIHHLNLSAAYYNEHGPGEYLDSLALARYLVPKYRALITTLRDLDRVWKVPAPTKASYYSYSYGDEPFKPMGYPFSNAPIGILALLDKSLDGDILDESEISKLSRYLKISKDEVQDAIQFDYLYELLRASLV